MIFLIWIKIFASKCYRERNYEFFNFTTLHQRADRCICLPGLKRRAAEGVSRHTFLGLFIYFMISERLMKNKEKRLIEICKKR